MKYKNLAAVDMGSWLAGDDEARPQLPEHALCRALLYQAILNAIKGNRSDLKWIEFDKRNTVFTFKFCCENLGIKPEIRTQILAAIPLLQAAGKTIRYTRTEKAPQEAPKERWISSFALPGAYRSIAQK